MISTFELFKIGIGPSSSHTVGPMKAAAAFAGGLVGREEIGRVARVKIELFGSLAWTGRGHGTDKAVVLGVSGKLPETIDPEDVEQIVEEARRTGSIRLAGSGCSVSRSRVCAGGSRQRSGCLSPEANR